MNDDKQTSSETGRKWVCTLELEADDGTIFLSESATSWIGPNEAIMLARALMVSAFQQLEEVPS